jgi:DinB superfamily
MRKASVGLSALLLACLSAIAAQAQELTQADKDRALNYLESTKKGLLDATKGLSAAQWSFKPAPDRWSVAEITEHVAAAEDMLRGLAQQVMKSPAVPARDAAEVRKTDELVLAAVPDRSHKAQAPEPLRPTNRFGSPQEAQKHFVQTRAETEDFLKNTPDLRAHLGDSPLGKLDGYDWVLLIAAHSERHTKQIQEVKADANFPAK